VNLVNRLVTGTQGCGSQVEEESQGESARFIRKIADKNRTGGKSGFLLVENR